MLPKLGVKVKKGNVQKAKKGTLPENVPAGTDHKQWLYSELMGDAVAGPKCNGLPDVKNTKNKKKKAKQKAKATTSRKPQLASDSRSKEGKGKGKGKKGKGKGKGKGKQKGKSKPQPGKGPGSQWYRNDSAPNYTGMGRGKGKGGNYNHDYHPKGWSGKGGSWY